MIVTGKEKPKELCWLVRRVDGRFEPVHRWHELTSEVNFGSYEAAKWAADMFNEERISNVKVTETAAKTEEA